MRKILSVILILMLAVMPAFAEEDDSVLTVFGQASVRITPDYAVLNVGFSAEKSEVEEALSLVNDHIAAMQAAAAENGVDADDMKSSSFDVYPSYDYSGSAAVVTGYRVTHMLAVTVRDISSVGTVLQALLETGANESYGISYGTTKYDEYYNDALSKAVANAAAKADTLAIASGVWLGSIASVNEQRLGYDYGGVMANTAEDKAEGPSLSEVFAVGSLVINACVEVTYNLR